MMFGLQLDTRGDAELERLLMDLNRRLQAELRVANQRIGLKVNRDAKQLLQAEIYNIPIPLKASADRRLKPGSKRRAQTTKGSAGKWMRTGNLKRDELFRVSGDGYSVTLTNNANYATPRADLGTSRSKRKAGVQRAQTDVPAAQRSQTRVVDHWQRRAAEQNRDWIRREYEAAIRRAFGRS